MVKYFALLAVVVGSLAAVDVAEARGHRRGCSSCYGGGGCAGGVCAVPYAPVAPAAPVKSAVVAPAAPVVAAAPAAPVATAPIYYSTARRGLFGWRR
jgi:hypothetical protein